MDVAPITNPDVAQLIDANLDRAREGLRVIEEWCRYGINRKDLVITLKDWRQQLGVLHKESYKQARSTESDYGIGLGHPSQNYRENPKDVIAANSARAQEALRVLEEFARTTDPALAKCSSKIRYCLYELELTVLKATNSQKLLQKLEECKLCLITRPQENLSEVIEAALKAGVKMVQYRNKYDNDKEKLSQVKQIAKLSKKYDALFIINDRIDLALAVDADGVHLGQNDFSTKTARKLIGKDKLIGRSTHSLDEIKIAANDCCDYIGVGPVYSTKTKPDATPIGTEYFKQIKSIARLPWFAIGGINCANLSKVCSAGAERIAVMGEIMQANNPNAKSLELLNHLQ